MIRHLTNSSMLRFNFHFLGLRSICSDFRRNFGLLLAAAAAAGSGDDGVVGFSMCQGLVDVDVDLVWVRGSGWGRGRL